MRRQPQGEAEGGGRASGGIVWRPRVVKWPAQDLPAVSLLARTGLSAQRRRGSRRTVRMLGKLARSPAVPHPGGVWRPRLATGMGVEAGLLAADGQWAAMETLWGVRLKPGAGRRHCSSAPPQPRCRVASGNAGEGSARAVLWAAVMRRCRLLLLGVHLRARREITCAYFSKY